MWSAPWGAQLIRAFRQSMICEWQASSPRLLRKPWQFAGPPCQAPHPWTQGPCVEIMPEDLLRFRGKLMIRDMTLRQKLRKILVPPPVLWMLVYKPQNSSSVYLYPKPVREFVELCEAQHFSRFNELENHLVVDPTESIYPNHETDRALGHRSSCDSPGWSQNLSQLYWLQLAISPAKAIGSYHFLGM